MKVARIDNYKECGSTIHYNTSLQPHFLHSAPSTSKFKTYADIFNTDPSPLYDSSRPCCYICFDVTPTVTCRYCEQKVGCAECMETWARCKWNSYEETTCPLCRVEWPGYYEDLLKNKN
ncbi:unnamed protein product [Bursaphelenchus xylophilus]|uniref:(pine wood nematode) hypothetical protein n=1 Tax=Bursaphelenchus xylophilus TaxID=6326 RepID=A0A1I7SR12_BURXY|nr:unnamed protein product [Bursaphelenchus xylophilus]CAG9110682.1 unnamed protein product [Bursaphelenchus xylophilus]